MTEQISQEQTTTVVKDDPTKVRKPPTTRGFNPHYKKERSEKQKAHDMRLAQMAIERKNERLEMKKKEEMKRNEEEKRGRNKYFSHSRRK